MNNKEIIQEKIKNNWELAKSLGTFGTVSLAGSVAAAIKYFETGNLIIMYVSGTGIVLGFASIIFLLSTYVKNLRLILSGKE